MLQSLMIKVESTEGDKVRLLETMRKYNRAANFVAEKAFDLKQIKTYYKKSVQSIYKIIQFNR
jgi:predicted transposase